MPSNKFNFPQLNSNQYKNNSNQINSVELNQENLYWIKFKLINLNKINTWEKKNNQIKLEK